MKLLQEIDTDCTKFYNSVQRHLTKTKSSSYDSQVIDLPVLKCNTMPNSTQFCNWMQNMASTIDKTTSFDGFTPLSYVVRESDGHVNHVELDQDTTFADRWMAVAILEGKHFAKDNQIIYTSIPVYITNCGLRYCDKHNTNKNGKAYRKYLVAY